LIVVIKRGDNMAMALGDQFGVILAIIIGTLFAIVYAMRVLILLERRIARMDMNLIKITRKIAEDEEDIEEEEKKIERILKKRK